jgi:hypothetical protein
VVALISRAALAAVLVAGCASPEATRTRDGGSGADPGNKDLVEAPRSDPRAADTTLWPGRATAPVDMPARGYTAPPTYPRRAAAQDRPPETPAPPSTPPSEPR